MQHNRRQLKQKKTGEENQYNSVPSHQSLEGFGGFLGQRVRTLQGPYVIRRLTGLCNTLSSTAGVLLENIPIDPDGTWGIQRWPSLTGLFKEFRYLKVTLRTGSVKAGSTNTGEGYHAVFLDEDEASAGSNPVASDANVHDCVWVSNANQSPSGGKFINRISWQPSTIDEADWQLTASPAAPAAFKIVIDPVETGSNSGTTSGAVLTQLVYDLEFRQLIS